MAEAATHKSVDSFRKLYSHTATKANETQVPRFARDDKSFYCMRMNGFGQKNKVAVGLKIRGSRGHGRSVLRPYAMRAGWQD